MTRAVVARKQPYVRLDTNLYSVPWNLIGQPMTLSATETQVRVIHQGQVVACHLRCWERFRVMTESSHLEGLADYKRGAASLSGRDLVCHAVPQAAALFEALLERNESTGYHTRRLLKLIDLWGTDAVARAVTRALSRKTPGADSVAFILERDFGQDTPPTIASQFERSDVHRLSIKNHDLEDYDDL